MKESSKIKDQIRKKETHSSKLKCPLERSLYLPFFSLVDYRNNQFSSADPEKILEFYDGFSNREQLIQWMKERPKGVNTIYEVNGNKDIIVVIPTADYNGKYAIECRENIFKDLHLIFVESGGKEDFYFNYAHNSNMGLKRAVEYNPKWIVISNDDMIKKTEVNELKLELRRYKPENFDVLFAKQNEIHSRFNTIGPWNVVGRLIINLSEHIPGFILKYLHKHAFQNIEQIILIFRNIAMVDKIKKKFGPTLFNISYSKYSKYFQKILFKYILTADFAIFSSEFLSKEGGILYDETFINGCEDDDLCIKIFHENRRVKVLNYSIDSIGRGSLGDKLDRTLRTIASDIYLESKIESIV